MIPPLLLPCYDCVAPVVCTALFRVVGAVVVVVVAAVAAASACPVPTCTLQACCVIRIRVSLLKP